MLSEAIHELYLQLITKKTKSDPIYPFAGSERYYRFPDFYTDAVIADAKYKRMLTLNKSHTKASDNIDRNDLHQMIAYMHIRSSKKGIFICPMDIDNIDNSSNEFCPESAFAIKTPELVSYSVGELNGYGGKIYIVGINIPQSLASYTEFMEAMEKTENILEQSMLKIMST